MRRAVVVLLLLIANVVFGSENAGDARASQGASVLQTVPGQLLQQWLTAGMTNSGNTPNDQRPENLAIGYTRFQGPELEPNTDTLPYRGMSAGRGEPNAADLLRFANALRVLSREMTEFVTTGKVEEQANAGPARYAYGFGDRNADCRRYVGHNGGAPGMNAELSILWNEGYAVVVLANLDPPIAQDAAQYIADSLQ